VKFMSGLATMKINLLCTSSSYTHDFYEHVAIALVGNLCATLSIVCSVTYYLEVCNPMTIYNVSHLLPTKIKFGCS
jgi:hypothetical protein